MFFPAFRPYFPAVSERKNARRLPRALTRRPLVSRSLRVVPRLEVLESRLAPATWQVTNTLDDGSAGCLRWAITQANADPDPGPLITFNIAQHNSTIYVLGSQPLPALTHPSVIIASTQQPVLLDGSQGPPDSGLVLASDTDTIEGLAFAHFAAGIRITGTDNQIYGVSIENNSIGVLMDNGARNNTVGGLVSGAIILTSIFGNAEAGIKITGGATGNKIQYTEIDDNQGPGLLIEGSGTTANQVLHSDFNSHGTGVLIASGASNNIIGSPDYNNGNGIGTDTFGIVIQDSGTMYNQALYNYISGADGAYDVVVRSGASNNTIGGVGRGALDFLNTDGVAIWITGQGTTGNQVVDTGIGGNEGGGIPVTDVLIDGGAQNNTISQNIMDLNVNSQGVVLKDPGTTGNVVVGNSIGIDLGLPTGSYGVQILDGASNNAIGGAAAGAGNTIASFDTGVYITGSGTTGNQVLGNTIGLNQYANTNDTGVRIDGRASGNTIGGTAAGAGNTISGNRNDGIEIEDSGTSNNQIEGNFIGTDSTGATGLGNGNAGVLISFAASNNTVGGSVPGAGNVMSGNTNYGVLMVIDASQNTVTGNRIGTDTSGSVALPNTDGVVIDSGSTRNQVLGNTISGNSNYGVWLTGGATQNQVGGNKIGTNAAGTAAVPNAYGVYLDDAPANTVGETGAGNVISGNSIAGVYINGSGSSGNVLEQNLIGTDFTGTIPLSNVQGVFIKGAPSNLIGGTAPGAGNTISGNRDDGIEIEDSGTSNNQVEGNFIGTDSTGTTGLGNGNAGVLISFAASKNTVGGSVPGAGNVISANTNYGVLMVIDASQNTVIGNRIGTDTSGSLALPNSDGVVIDSGSTRNQVLGNTISGNSNYGVWIAGAATQNEVGGNKIGTNAAGTAAVPNAYGVYLDDASSNSVGVAGAGNVISGNSIAGVYINGSGSSGNVLEQNLIGTDFTGTIPLSNVQGVFINGAPSNLIGGTAPGAGNIISGNTGAPGSAGIYLLGSGATGNVIQGNRLGTDALGFSSVGNVDGILINNAPDNTVGGTGPFAGNVISGNVANGIFLFGSGTTGNDIQGNTIGMTRYQEAPLGNGLDGVLFAGGPNGNTVASNVLAFNGNNGVSVGSDANDTGTQGDAVRGNSIFGNSHLGIDLANDGVTPNGGYPRSFPNDGQQFPVLAGVTYQSASTVLLSGLLATPNNDVYAIDFYADAAADPSGFGQGQVYLGTVVLTSDNSEAAFALVPLSASPDVLAHAVFTATATDLFTGDTSEFAADLYPPPGPYLVTTTADSGLGSLRDAITQVNADTSHTLYPSRTDPTRDEIDFDIPGSGVQSIAVGSTTGLSLPAITAAVTIDGYWQPGSSPSTTTTGNNAVLLIQLDGTFAPFGFNGLTITGGDCTVRGLVINRFPGDGIAVLANGGDQIEGNFIGTDPSGNAGLGNYSYGIDVETSGNTIGGTFVGAGNVVCSNTGPDGVNINGDNNLVAGNLIGVDAAGTAALGNNYFGLVVAGTGNTVGGAVPAARNVISGNINTGGGQGIELVLVGAVNTLVEGNYLGTDVTGNAAVANSYNVALAVYAGSGNTIGGTTSAARNVISGHYGNYGVALDYGATGTVIEGNYVGITAAGDAVLADAAGIAVYSSSNNIIGGTVPGAGNVISGNTFWGVHVGLGSIPAPSTNNLIAGNFIGTDPSGTQYMGNGAGGVLIDGGSSNNTVGGTTAAARNLISGNANQDAAIGVQISGPSTTGNVVEGNFIGTDITGTLPLINGFGVLLDQGAAGNLVGGTAAGAGNVIAFNGRAGVVVGDSAGDSTTTGNAIRANAIYANAGLGIDLGNDGVTPNHAGNVAGPNNFQNFPVLAEVDESSSTLVIGTLNSLPSTTYTVDFFASPSADPSGYGEGQSYLGSTTVTTNAAGNASFIVTFNTPFNPAQAITATATDPAGNTSEFSHVADLPLTATGTTVTTTEGGAFSGVVASFTDTDPHAVPSDFAATVYWSDGSAPTSGTIGVSGSGFTVIGSHVFAEEGSYIITVQVRDQGSSQDGTTSPVSVAIVPPTAGMSGPGNGVPGQPRTFTFTATDPSPTDEAAGFVYAITWGDGSPVQTIARTAGNGSGVSVDHVYTTTDSFTVSVTATEDGGSSGTASQAVTIRRVQMQGNSLAVGGTPGNDTIVLAPADTAGDVNVKLNGASLGTFLPTDHILVYSQTGNDTIQLASPKIAGLTYYVTVPAFLYGGGRGTDKDILNATGSTANNVLLGGAGTNVLTGGLGRDLLIAGQGAAQLHAGTGEDILIGGWTDYDLSSTALTYDKKLQALQALMAEWGRTDLGTPADPTGYQARVKDLLGPTAGGTAGGRNGPYYLNASAVHSSAVGDTLFGAPGALLDWFFASSVDVVKNQHSGEVVTTIA
jgi:hypothetical protein